MSYSEFCKIAATPLTLEEMRSTAVIEDATPQEIQWWKGWQVKRAIRHKGAGVATAAELELLENKTSLVISAHDYRAAKAKERRIDHQNADIYIPLESFK